MKSTYLFMLFAMVLSACASINNEEVSYQKVTIDDSKDLTIENQFIAEELSVTHLEAFEQRGMEKLKDFADYLNIISDHTFEEEFRHRAHSQARGLFIENSEFRLKDSLSSERMDSFLGGLVKNTAKAKFLITDITIEETLKETAGSLYEGTLSFSYTSDANVQQKKKAEFFLMKTPKVFGTNQKMVWEIFLGDIY